MNTYNKQSRAYLCPQCQVVHYIEERLGLDQPGGITGAVILGAAAFAATKDPWLTIAAVGLGWYLGHEALDKQLLKACPECAGALRILERVVVSEVVPTSVAWLVP